MEIEDIANLELVYVPSRSNIISYINKHYGEKAHKSFFIEEMGIWCPWGDEGFIRLSNLLGLSRMKIVSAGQWVFVVVNKKKWMLTKIKYGI